MSGATKHSMCLREKFFQPAKAICLNKLMTCALTDREYTCWGGVTRGLPEDEEIALSSKAAHQ
jgi:hypothetical protein